GATSRFWYRKASKGTVEFIVFDAITRQRRPAFDHARLAAGLSKVTGTTYAAGTLPFQTITFAEDEQSVDVTVEGAQWTCALDGYACRKTDRQRRRDDAAPRLSPDRKWEALIVNYNLAVRPAGGLTRMPITLDGSEGNAYELSSVV